MEKKSFGKLADGREAFLYTIRNSKGMSAVISDYGALLVDLNVPFSDGKTVDVVCGYDSVEGYFDNPCFFGALIAPNGNRIAGAKVSIDGVDYALEVNDGENNLHSSYDRGAHKRLWSVKESSDSSITLGLNIPDGDIGYPGNINISVTYEITEDNAIKLYYEGGSDKNTVLNPTNHSYFNLAGHDCPSVLDHVLTLKSSYYTEVREGSIPTGKLNAVAGTIFDFTKGRRIGDDIDDADPQNVITGGYDHNFAIDGYKEGQLTECAEVKEPATGRVMKVYTDLPGVQFYAGNYIKEQPGKRGSTYGKRCSLCLETQYFPDTPHHEEFVSAIHGPERPYKSTTVYKFS